MFIGSKSQGTAGSCRSPVNGVTQSLLKSLSRPLSNNKRRSSSFISHVAGAGKISFQDPRFVSSTSAAPEALSHVAVPRILPTFDPSSLVLKPELLSGQANFQNIVDIGTTKASYPALKIFILGIMGGAFIGMSGYLMTSFGATVPGLHASDPGVRRLICAMAFPFGLMMVLLGGAELFTGNTATVTMALIEGKVTWKQLAKNFFFSYAGNFVGSLLIVGLMLVSGTMKGNGMLVTMAINKTAHPFIVAFVRAVLANWLVCIAVIQAAGSSSLVGKAVAIWMPITAFVAIGLEHSIANMFIIPAGMALGAPVTLSDFFIKNLIPVTIGNIFAGMVIMGPYYCTVFGSLGKKKFGF